MVKHCGGVNLSQSGNPGHLALLEKACAAQDLVSLSFIATQSFLAY
jgi:hypothetical protein